MTIKYTKEQLNKFDKDLLIELFLGMQGQMEELSRQTQALNDRMQLMMEQMVLFQKNRFGRSSEKMADSEQIRFMEVDGTIVFFNEAEAVCDLDAPEPEDLELKAPKKKKQPGKKAADIAGLTVKRIDHFPDELRIIPHGLGGFTAEIIIHTPLHQGVIFQRQVSMRKTSWYIHLLSIFKRQHRTICMTKGFSWAQIHSHIEY